MEDEVPVTQRRRLHPMFIFLSVAVVGLVLAVVLGIRGKHDPAAVQVHADFARVLAALDVYRAEHGSIPEEGDLSFRERDGVRVRAPRE